MSSPCRVSHADALVDNSDSESSCPEDVNVARGGLKVSIVVRLMVIGVIGIGCCALAVGRRQSSLSVASGEQDFISDVSVTAVDRKKCSKMNENCFKTKCCSTPGTQCYAKKDKWATCKASCTPGPDPLDANDDHWSCEGLGPRAPGPAPPPNYALKKEWWVDTKCAGVGENCENSMCCRASGTQCFRKVKGWAACKQSCVAGGPDVTDANNDPWECKALGSRTPGVAQGGGIPAAWVKQNCSDNGEDCSSTKCCKLQGQTCYAKTDKWAMCMPKCTPGPLLFDREYGIWSCKELGPRTPGIAQQDGHTRPAKWVEDNCSKAGDDCSKTMCCAGETLQCYQKNDKWASCMRGCNPGHPQKGDNNEDPWSCTALGPRMPRAWSNPSLYCFHVIRVNSYEADITRFEASKDGGVGVFACELYDIFASDGEAWLGDGPLGPIHTHHFTGAAISRSVDGTAGNTALFMNVWASVNWIGRWKLTDWTIKVDPDAVLIPDRMRYNHLKYRTGTPCYVVNCNKAGMATGPMMFGSIESVSRQGLESYFVNTGKCNWGYQCGEDRWFGGCLSRLGVQGVQDFGEVGDGVCTGANCGDGKAAYHPFKNVGAWAGCLAQATR